MFPRLPAVLVPILLLLPACPAASQEKSVRPGINDEFRNPDVSRTRKKLENEGREAFQKREAIVAACGLKPGMAVADIGAGTGVFTRLIAPAVTPGGKVFAVDISQKLVDHVVETCRQQQIAGVEGVVCTDKSTTLPADAIDLAFVCDTYHHFEYPQKTLSSIHQALRPGGRLIVIDFKKEPGKTSERMMKHVRADEKTVVQEITAARFRLVKEVDLHLAENYFLIFAKLPLP